MVPKQKENITDNPKQALKPNKNDNKSNFFKLHFQMKIQLMNGKKIISIIKVALATAVYVVLPHNLILRKQN